MSLTPRIKLGICGFFVLGILSFSCFWFFRDSGESKYARGGPKKWEEGAYYLPVTVDSFTRGMIPCFNVEIENVKLLFMLDLGYSADSGILDKHLKEIKEKTFHRSKFMSGFNGKIYSSNVYQIPQMKIGPIIASSITIDEEDSTLDEKMFKNYTSVEGDPVVSGNLGWMLFNHTTLLLDLGHSTIAVCDSVETFEKQGFSLKKFTKVPMLDDQKLIEFKTMSSRGPLRCMLDTGCTYNFLKHHDHKNKSFDEHIMKKRNYKKVSSFKIENTEFGPIRFCKIPIHHPTHIDAVLGMDFLFKHVVYIDFNNRQIYFSKK